MITTDTALLSRLHAECFAEPWDEESFRALLAAPGCFALVDDERLGFIVIQVAADQSEVLSLGVRPAARRRGIAAVLLAKALQGAAERGAAEMFLEVDCMNFQAIGLYRRYGFEEAGRRKNYYHFSDGSRHDALMLRVEIHAPRVGNGMQLG